MRTLRSRTFLGITAALFLLSGVMGALFYAGLQRSVTVWNVNRTRHLHATLTQEVLRVDRQEGALHQESLRLALERFLTPGVSMAVLGPDQNVVFLVENGTLLDPGDPETTSPIMAELGETRSPALAIFDQDRIVGYLSVDTLGFRSDLSNRLFINSIIVSIAVAVVLSLLLALVVALLISRRLTGHARILATGLTDLARGNRSVTFARSGAEELRAIADAARALQVQLNRGEQLRNQWMQDIAHDLRTPVTALSSQLEGMIEGVLQPSPERLRSIYRELQRVEELVRDLRELSRVESPELTVELHPLSVSGVIHTVLERLKDRSDAAGNTWVVEVEPVQCLGDKSLLLRALTNVLENALLHGEAGREISVHARRDGNSIRIRVANYGYIPEDALPQLFDRLFRGDRSRTAPGSGLGLAITRAILERHGGEITITQNSGLVVAEMTLMSLDAPLDR